jgi:rare lipoprotein A
MSKNRRRYLALIFLLIFHSTAHGLSGKASWYSEASCKREGTSGTHTASGERFSDNGLTCALRSRAWGRSYLVTNLDNGKTVIVRHNDFGPGKKATSRGVVIDLSPAAFEKIADKELGIITVMVEEVR